MAPLDPLPFRIKVRDPDIIDWQGIRSVSYLLDGLVHVVDKSITLEWTATRRTRRLWFTGIKDEVDRSPLGTLQVPVGSITRARVRGWWTPRLQLWARRLEAFDGIPGARGATLTLRIHRRDREHAHTIAVAIDTERAAVALTEAESPLEIGGSDVPRLGDRVM